MKKNLLLSLPLFILFALISAADSRAQEEENILRIKAENDRAAAYMLIGYKENAADGFLQGEDVQKLFSPYSYVPEIYALASDIPVDIRFINNKKDMVVPLGIKTDRTGDIRLTFTGMDNYFKASKIEFIDKQDSRTINLTGMASYTYTFTRTGTGIQNDRFELRFGLGESTVIWTPGTGGSAAQKQDWNNAANWTPATVPTAVHSVYIAGNLDYYPQLTSAAAAKCRYIYFMQGGELGRPDLLTYKRAYVQYNFGLTQTPQITNRNDKDLVLKSGATADRLLYSASVSAAPLKRERWYMLSSPLHGIVTGDLGFGGFPLTFLMKFGPVNKDNQNYPVGNWTTSYTNMVETLNSTDGFAYYVYGFNNASGDNTGCFESGGFNQLNDLTYLPEIRGGKNYGFKEINGILELPFFADSTGLYAHRTQVYEEASRRSTFYYIDNGKYGGQAEFNKLLGTTVGITREDNDGNYRFMPETRSGNAWVFPQTIFHPGANLSGNVDLLLGNPYMSSIDMVAFLEDNSATLQQQFKIWNGTNFISYSVSGGSVENPDNAANPRYVAPLQAFFLKTKEDYNGSGNVAKFDVVKISKTRPPGGVSNLRSDAAKENLLRIKAENDRAASYLLIGYKENASNGFRENEDVSKLFSPYSYVPEIYALADEMPVDINFINTGRAIIVPLGIKTERTAEIRLTFTGMDNYFKASKIELIDALKNQTIDLTGRSSYTYSFTPTETGIQNGRFSLRIENSTTALPDINGADDLKVYGNSKGIYVVSSASEPVQQLIVYDFGGRKMYESAADAKYYPLPENIGHLPLIVKVITKSGARTVKVNP